MQQQAMDIWGGYLSVCLEFVLIAAGDNYLVDLFEGGEIWVSRAFLHKNRQEGGEGSKKRRIQTLSTILHSCVARRSCCLLPIKGSMTKCSRISNSRVLA